MRNPYAVRNSCWSLRTNLRTNMDLKMNASLENGWEDELDADLRRLVLEHADRTVQYHSFLCCGNLG